jgi:superoxide reductase
MEIQKMKDFLNPTELEKKHTPVVKRLRGGEVLVQVGIVPHPMEEKHYIQWIELYRNKVLFEKRDLKPGMLPEAKFNVPDLSDDDYLSARELCNIHGLWESV